MEAEGRKATFSRGSRRLHLFKWNSEETVALQMAFLQQLQRQISPARGRRQPCLQLHLHASRDARRGHSSLYRVETYHCPLPSALRGSETEKEFHKDRRMPHTGWTSYCMAWTLIPHGLLLSEAIHGEPSPSPPFSKDRQRAVHTLAPGSVTETTAFGFQTSTAACLCFSIHAIIPVKLLSS